jgi:hypothetical protein
MAKPVALVRQRWTKVNHPFVKFFFETDHVDIDVSVAPEQDGVSGHAESRRPAASSEERLESLSEV